MDALLRLLLTNAALSGLLALAAWVGSRVIRRQAVVHGLWLLALVKLLTPPLVGLPLLPARDVAAKGPERLAAARESLSADPAPAAAPAAPAAGPRPSPGPERRPAEGASPRARAAAAEAGRVPAPSSPRGIGSVAAPLALPALLSLGAFAVAGLTALRFVRFRRLLSVAEPAPPGLVDRAARLAESLGVKRVPHLLLVPARVPPMLWPAAPAPLLLLPRDLLPDLTDEERDALLAHELAHVRRRDHWVRFLEIGATALFWWYPVTWWARRALRRAEERCCDEWVLRALPSSARDYASGILKSLTFLAVAPVPLPSAASGAGPIEDLEARLKEILMTNPLPRLSRPARLALGAAAIASLALVPTVAPTRAAQAAAVLPGGQGTPAPETLPSPAPRAPAAARAGTPMPAIAPRLPVTVAPNVRKPLPYLVASAAPLAFREGGEGDPVLDAERRALEEQRRQLQLSQLELERKSLDLDAKARRKEAGEEIARLKADGDADGVARVGKRGALSDRRAELARRQLDLQAQELKLEAELEHAAEAGEKAGGAAEGLRAAEHAEQELETKRQALEAETEKLDREMQALDAELRVHELRGATDDLARSLAEQVASLREALPEAGAQEAELEKEIEKLEAALGALKGGASRTKSPAPGKPQAR